MAELDTSGGGGKKGGKVRSKKASTRVDLTAMVDLAFLLVTFFMLTTTLNKPKAMDLIMPDKDQKTNLQEPVPETRSMTILLGKDHKLEWFIGQIQKPLTPPTVDNFGKDGIRKVLLDESKRIREASGGKPMIVLVKPSDKSVYGDMVNIMDELNIANIDIRAIVDITQSDINLLQRDNLY
jgi:biopolymer transport protein ExbD